MVVALIAIIGAFTVTRLDSVSAWQHEGDIREFLTTWQFLHNEATARGDSYRLVIDLDENSYYVLREVLRDPGESVEVDYLQNLRTQGEQRRRREAELENLKTLDEEFEEEDIRLSAPLDALYYRTKFRDPYAASRLALPLEFPSLAEKKRLSAGLEFRDVVIAGETFTGGQVALRLAPSAGGQFGVVHFQTDEQIFTVVNDPATANVRVENGDLEFTWFLRQNENDSAFQ